VLHVEIAASKVPKYAVRESGDSVEIVERPHGGLSVVMADGQRSGRSAKAISNIAVRKSISLLSEGVRDGAVARATHDYLRTQRNGQVTAELTIISVDLETRTLVISRNSRCPVVLGDGGSWRMLDEPSESAGARARLRPVIVELPLEAGQTVIGFSDGVLHAGARVGRPLDLPALLADPACCSSAPAQEIADRLLNTALALDDGRPADDITVVVVRVTPSSDDGDNPEVRRMLVSFPVPDVL
jgi:serine phosphatase RsbU (regulator of sigma subunit)